jgi:hypothetical protein
MSSRKTLKMKKLLVLGMLLFCFCIADAQTSPHGDIKIACANCHTTDSWRMRKDAQFNHASTSFELTGIHKTISCKSCHEELLLVGTKKECQVCHADVHKGNLGPDCARCHSTQTWHITDMIQRHQQTRFPLLGRHGLTECQACHVQYTSQVYMGTPTTCTGCHILDFQNAQNPNHLAAGFSTDCAQCHQINALSWNFIGGNFNHQATAFPLTGAHRAVPCSQCHSNNNFKSTPQDCYSCHAAIYLSVQSPNHAAGGFSHLCVTCHTTNTWNPSTFSHDNTAFPLVGAHRAILCEQCHINNQYAGLHTNCIDCHQTNFNTATNPNHVAGAFSTNCVLCHSMNAWQPATFNHGTTNFSLTGAHISVQCQQCHTNGNYQLTYTGCSLCHISDFTSTTNPNHVASGFPKTCETCHSTTSWTNATFDHSTTNFPLTGAHTSVQCQTCHTNGNYQLTYTGCYSCHTSDFTGTTNPNHVTSGFSTTCQNCHSTTNWSGATFDHNTTKFPLSGAHTSIPCQTCHTNGNYQLSYTGCYMCHSTDFTGTTNPNHVTSGFPKTCETCHNTTTWASATFDHSTTKFPLTGAHTSVQCQTCHTNGNYQLTYTGCYACHSSDFNGTTNPNHTAAKFPTTCETCHTTSTWVGAIFNHTWFPTSHGNANGVCAICHTNPADYSVFQCTVCHTKAQTDPRHTGVNGYVWNSTNCYACHPRGSGD